MGCECHASGRAVCVCVLTVFRRSCSATLILELRPQNQSATDDRSAGPSSRVSVRLCRALAVCVCVSSRCPFVCVQQEQQEEDREVFRFSPLLSLSPSLSSDPAQHPTGLFLSQTNTPRDTQGLTSLTRPYVTSSSSSSLCGCGKFRTEFFVNSPRVASFTPCGAKIRRC